MKPCAQKAFFPFLEQHYPQLVQRYRHRYESAHYLRGEYQKQIAERVHAIREEFGLSSRLTGYEPDEQAEDTQLSLF